MSDSQVSCQKSWIMARSMDSGGEQNKTALCDLFFSTHILKAWYTHELHGKHHEFFFQENDSSLILRNLLFRCGFSTRDKTIHETASKNHPDSFSKQVTVLDERVQKHPA